MKIMEYFDLLKCGNWIFHSNWLLNFGVVHSRKTGGSKATTFAGNLIQEESKRFAFRKIKQNIYKKILLGKYWNRLIIISIVSGSCCSLLRKCFEVNSWRVVVVVVSVLTICFDYLSSSPAVVYSFFWKEINKMVPVLSHFENKKAEPMS